MRKRLLVGACLLALLLAGLGAIYTYQVRAKRAATVALSDAATRLSDCLVGDTTGDVTAALEQEALGARAALVPDESDTRWPKRCLVYVDPIEGAVRRARSFGVVVDDLPIAEVRHDLAAGWVARETREPDVAEILGLLDGFRHGAHDPTVPRAPAPAPPAIATNALVPMGGDVALVDREKHGARFVLDAGEGAILCDYTAVTAKARCHHARESPLFADGEIGAPWVFAQGNEVLDEKGARLSVVPSSAEVSHVRSFTDGRVAAMDLTWSPEAMFCARMAFSLRGADGRLVRSSPLEDLAATTPRFGGSYAVWKTPSSVLDPAAPSRLRARSIVDVRAPPVTLGPVTRRSYTELRTDGTCEADALFFDMSPALVALDAGGAWHVHQQQPLALAPPRSDRNISCEGERLQIVDVAGGTLKLQQCDARSGCTTAAGPTAFPYEAKAIASGADVVMLWVDGVAGVVYFVRAPVAKLATAVARPLVRTALGRGGELTMFKCEMAAFGGDVLALMNGGSNTYGFVIHADGTASTVPVAK